jgi:hypothetical protein
MGVVVYEIDQHDRLVFVNDEWDTFALLNDGANVTRRSILTHSLWEFISDATTQQIYRKMLARIRMGRNVQFQFRCDSPECVQLLEMTVFAVGDRVRFETRTVTADERPAVPLLDIHMPRTEDFLRVCAWCSRVLAEGLWKHVEEAMPSLGLHESPALPQISHGMCPDCVTRVMAEIPL